MAGVFCLRVDRTLLLNECCLGVCGLLVNEFCTLTTPAVTLNNLQHEQPQKKADGGKPRAESDARTTDRRPPACNGLSLPPLTPCRKPRQGHRRTACRARELAKLEARGIGPHRQTTSARGTFPSTCRQELRSRFRNSCAGKGSDEPLPNQMK